MNLCILFRLRAQSETFKHKLWHKDLKDPEYGARANLTGSFLHKALHVIRLHILDVLQQHISSALEL